MNKISKCSEKENSIDKVKFRVLPVEGLWLGSANHGHSKASFSFRLSGRIHRRIKNEFFDIVTCLKADPVEFDYPLH
jgi:hypothetical protein